MIDVGFVCQVFCADTNGKPVAYKVMPLEGEVLVNGEPQKTAGDLILEVVASLELSNLADGANTTNGKAACITRELMSWKKRIVAHYMLLLSRMTI